MALRPTRFCGTVFGMEDILLIDKPAGITSFDVIRQLRRRTGIKKMGHAGTLDPLATGLMIIGVGPGTKKLTQLIKLDKEYLAEIRIGESRSTGDLEGKITATEPVAVESISKETIMAALVSMVGTLTLPVSAYSAIKVDGVPMYKRARAAAAHSTVVDENDVPVRQMGVTAAEYLNHEYTAPTGVEGSNDVRLVVSVRFFVGSGTYIRSLAEEFGKRLGYPATLQLLRRTQVGEFRIENAKQIEEFDVNSLV